jgi:hypothetical protein
MALLPVYGTDEEHPMEYTDDEWHLETENPEIFDMTNGDLP